MLDDGVGVVARVGWIQRDVRVVVRAIEQSYHGVRGGDQVQRVTRKVRKEVVLPCHVDRGEAGVRRGGRGKCPAEFLDERAGEPGVEAAVRSVEVGEHDERHRRHDPGAGGVCGTLGETPLCRGRNNGALGVAEDDGWVRRRVDRRVDHPGSGEDRKIEEHVVGAAERPELSRRDYRNPGVVPAERWPDVAIDRHINPCLVDDVHVGTCHDQCVGGGPQRDLARLFRGRRGECRRDNRRTGGHDDRTPA